MLHKPKVTKLKPIYDHNADPVKIAMSKGQVIVTPAPNELLLDIDTPEQVTRFAEGLHMLMQMGVKVSYKQTPSKTPGHYHVTVSMDIDVPDMERIALQAILGSDPRRELYSWFRCRALKLATVFFENANTTKQL